MAAERARPDPPAQGRYRGRGGGPAGRSSRRMGSPTGSRAGAPGPRRRGHRGCLHPGRPRSPAAGALEGAPAEHRPAAGAAARGAGRDRDRGRRHRPGSIGRGRTGARRRPVREQSVDRRRRPRPGRVRLADGDAAGAEQSLSDAVRLWNDVGAPYEAALARMLAEAHAAGGSEHRAVLERRRPARSSTGSKPGRRAPAPRRAPRRSRRAPGRRSSTSSVARATTGR